MCDDMHYYYFQENLVLLILLVPNLKPHPKRISRIPLLGAKNVMSFESVFSLF